LLQDVLLAELDGFGLDDRFGREGIVLDGRIVAIAAGIEGFGLQVALLDDGLLLGPEQIAVDASVLIRGEAVDTTGAQT
jgi:hypothetical protein